MRRVNKYIPIFIQNYFHEKREATLNLEEYNRWKINGCPMPPPHYAKQEIIETYARKFSCRTLIETGTYLGDTIFSQKENFSRIISVELSRKFYKAAARRFKKHKHISIVFGNSGHVLNEIIPENDERILFWLDGHYSSRFTAKGEKESPIFEELTAIFEKNSQKNVILIDDARMFVGKRDYPTVSDLREFIMQKDSDYLMNIESDIIILTKD